MAFYTSQVQGPQQPVPQSSQVQGAKHTCTLDFSLILLSFIVASCFFVSASTGTYKTQAVIQEQKQSCNQSKELHNSKGNLLFQ